MTKTIVTVAACATLLWAGVALGAQDPSQKCQQQRYNAAAKYAACQQKAVGKFLASGNTLKFGAANRTCTAKYAAAWAKLQVIGTAPCSGTRFVDNGDGTVTDNLTALVWEKKTNDSSVHDEGNTYTWSTGSPYEESGTVYG